MQLGKLVSISIAVVGLAASGCGVGAVGSGQDATPDSADLHHHGSSGGTGSCTSYAAPDQAASCRCGSGHTCTANGCYGGWYCDLTSDRCVSPSTVPSCPGTSSTTSSGGTSGGNTSGTSTSSTSSTSSSTTSSGGSGGGGCPGYAAPDEAAGCTCGWGHTCSANGCYGGWYCNLSTDKCVAPPSSCGTGSTTSSGGTSTTSGGTTTTSGTSGSGTTTGSGGTTTSTGGTSAGNWTGNVGPQGGTVSRLYFAAVGDSRPPNLDQTSQYPTSVITQIYKDISSTNPEFVVATGDYMFASPSGSAGPAQMSLYMQARQAYPGTVFAAMGNHECNGYTASNCTSVSQSNNFGAFMQNLVQPLGYSTPYYRYDVNDAAGQWTAKFIVLAMNAWDQTQATWLQQQMAQSTTYTFIIRHEPEAATTAPGVTPSDNIIDQYPYTLKIVGHTHEFSRPGTREVIVGNGGAPLSGTGSYGYAIIEQTASGDLQVSAMDFNSNSPVQTFVVPK